MLKCASFFAGVGGIDIGFENAKLFDVVYANELDPYPVKTYELNSNPSTARKPLSRASLRLRLSIFFVLVKAGEVPINGFFLLLIITYPRKKV